MIVALHLLGGVIALCLGANLLIRGAVRVAALLRVPTLVIGLTVVAYGTSAPELAVSTAAAVNGQPDIALGNVVGSNIFNVLFILGVSALILPLGVARQLVRFDVPLMIGLSLAVLLLGADLRLERWEGIACCVGLAAYTAWLIGSGRQAGPAEPSESLREPDVAAPQPVGRVLPALGLVSVGLALLVVGSRWFVAGAVDVARLLQLSELVIGLTIVAAGTSLPEVATSVWATIKGERDIAVGNVVGSNIFNILGVLGVSSAVAPGGITISPQAATFDIPVMIAVAAACLPLFFTSYLIARWEGALLLGYYALYLTALILQATNGQWLPTFNALCLYLALPLTVLVLGMDVARSIGSSVPDTLPPGA